MSIVDMVLRFYFEGLLKEGDRTKSVDTLRANGNGKCLLAKDRGSGEDELRKLWTVQAAQYIFVAMVYDEGFLNVASFFPG